MSNTPRFVILAVCLGIGISAVTFLGAARLTGTSTEKDNKDKPVKDTSRGVICVGTVDVEDGRLEVYPNCFPQPCTVLKVLVRDGQKVKSGQHLVEIDTTIAKLKIEQAKSDVERYEALLAQSKLMVEAHSTAIEVQEAAVQAKQSAKSSAEIKLKESYNQKRILNTTKFDSDIAAAEEGIKALQSEIKAEEHKLNGLKKVKPTSKVDEARAGLDTAKTTVKLAEEAAALMVCTAPCDGTILRVNAHPGVVGPNTRSPLFILLPDKPFIIRAEVEQEFAHRVKADMVANITDFHTGTINSLKGKVYQVANAFMPKRNDGGSINLLSSSSDASILEVLISIDPEEAKKLRFGQRVRVGLEE